MKILFSCEKGFLTNVMLKMWLYAARFAGDFAR